MAYCKNCGSQIPSGGSFCKDCGTKFKIPHRRRFKLSYLAIGALALFFWYAASIPSCDLPVAYSIGNVDSRFNLSKDDVLKSAREAETKWDSATGKNMLEYDPNSALKINLVYDQRQADIDNIKSQAEQLNLSGTSYDSLSERLDLTISQYDRDLDQYNSDVDFWNSRGGAPDNIYYQLQSQKNNLDRRRQSINSLASLLDIQAESYNSNLANLQNTLKQKENEIITQGLYYTNENKVDVFTFGNADELRLVLMHELGHAFGIDHAQKPDSLMYSLLGAQNVSNPVITQEDINLVDAQCNIK